MGDNDGGWMLSLVGGSTLTKAAQRAREQCSPTQPIPVTRTSSPWQPAQQLREQCSGSPTAPPSLWQPREQTQPQSGFQKILSMAACSVDQRAVHTLRLTQTAVSAFLLPHML